VERALFDTVTDLWIQYKDFNFYQLNVHEFLKKKYPSLTEEKVLLFNLPKYNKIILLFFNLSTLVFFTKHHYLPVKELHFFSSFIMYSVYSSTVKAPGNDVLN
jgi:hypothetical protein